MAMVLALKCNVCEKSKPLMEKIEVLGDTFFVCSPTCAFKLGAKHSSQIVECERCGKFHRCVGSSQEAATSSSG